MEPKVVFSGAFYVLCNLHFNLDHQVRKFHIFGKNVVKSRLEKKPLHGVWGYHMCYKVRLGNIW